ncbi:hypothetical protein F4677DRAFT_436354 [Hypoxylon crocopeplum]|nr:hypothetical protein F4677DRAFT_436354 [Hypoxylon crocopeplum]
MRSVSPFKQHFTGLIALANANILTWTMKLAHGLCFLYMRVAAVAGAWLDIPDLPLYFQQLGQFLQIPMATSSIPTFILDTDHPWLSENRRWLESYPDVASALCDKSSPLWTDPSPGHEIPPDLFRRINIDNNKSGIDRLGWDNAVSRLRELRDCPAALEDVRHLHVYIYVHTGQYSDPLVEPEMPPTELPGLFAEVLTLMPNLERLDWGLNPNVADVFREEFVRRNLTLPSVRHLIPGAWSHYLLPMCLGLETLEAGSFFHHGSWNSGYREEGDPRRELVRAASVLSSLKEFLMLDSYQTTEKLEEVLEAMPNLTKLTMQGSLGRDIDWHESIISEDIARNRGGLLKKYLAVISRFPKLEQLGLPESSRLDLGFDGGNWCGNAYRGAGGRRYGRSVINKRVETTEIAGDIVAESLPHLKMLWIGEIQANLTHNENGDLQITWPWTGRKEEYTYEIFPE